MYHTITPGKSPGQNGVGSSHQTIDIKVPGKSVELSTLYVILPSHFAKLAKGPDHPEVEASRLRMGNTIAFNPFPWDVVAERTTELFNKGKLRHVATVEEAHAEMDRVKKHYDASLKHR